MAAHQHDHHHGEHDHATHAHDHGHAHAPKDFGFTFAIVTALNVALVVLQVVFGVMANSVALLPGWGPPSLCTPPPPRRYTYGFRSASILAALAKGVILLVATGAIAWE